MKKNKYCNDIITLLKQEPIQNAKQNLENYHNSKS